MKWRGREGSSNIEDGRRSYSGGGGFRPTGGFRMGGLGLIIVAVLYLIMGGNPLDMITGGGPSVSSNYEPTAADEEKMEFLSVVLKDTEDVWKKIFEDNGLTYEEPVMHIFHGAVKSACGVQSAQAGPFYCPGDRKLYMDLDFFDELSKNLGAQGDFAIAYVVAHEVGHHVQNMLGIMREQQSKRQTLSETEYNKISVAIELQADYLAGVFARWEDEAGYLEKGDFMEAINATSAVGDDTLQKKYQGAVVPDSFTHGTAEQRERWFKRGYEAGDLSQGDTFSVPYDEL